ncbi:MAG: hypothetical protein ACK5NG_02545, partial [Chthoniobacterales bacterium]
NVLRFSCFIFDKSDSLDIISFLSFRSNLIDTAILSSPFGRLFYIPSILCFFINLLLIKYYIKGKLLYISIIITTLTFLPLIIDIWFWIGFHQGFGF